MRFGPYKLKFSEWLGDSERGLFKRPPRFMQLFLYSKGCSNMKGITVFNCALFVGMSIASLQTLSAQTIYGMRQGILPWEQGLYLGGYDIMSNTWVYGDTLEYAEGFGLGTSTFNQWDEAYVFLGLPSGGTGLEWMSHSVEAEGAETTAEVFGNMHSIHHDMQNGKFYGLEGYGLDSTWMDWGTRVITLEVEDGQVNTIPILEMDWMQGVVAGSSCYDSDLHHFYIWGIDNTGVGRLVTVDCEAGSIVADVSPEMGSNANLSEFEFNINDGQLIGLKATYTANGDADMELIVVDPLSGVITPQLALPQVDFYTPDGTEFDQLNGFYILHYYQDQGIGLNSSIMAIDAATWEVVVDVPLDANFVELEMSNASFATLRYSPANVSDESLSRIDLEKGYWINNSPGSFAVRRFDITGRLAVPATTIPPNARLEVPSGNWLWDFQGINGLRFSRHTIRS